MELFLTLALLASAQAQHVKSNSISDKNNTDAEIIEATEIITPLVAIGVFIIVVISIHYRLSFQELMRRRLPGAEEKLMYAMIAIRNLD